MRLHVFLIPSVLAKKKLGNKSPALDGERPYAYNITYRKDGVHLMATATITSKGQTTIPKEVRAAANLKPGDRIHFAVLEDGTIIVRVKNRSIRDIAFKPPGGKRVSIAQMNR
jgi:antitoxin PrlF